MKYQTHHIIFQLRQQLRNLLSHISATRHCPDLLQDARLGPLRFLQQLEPVSHQVGINCIIWLLSVFRIIPNHSSALLPVPCRSRAPKKRLRPQAWLPSLSGKAHAATHAQQPLWRACASPFIATMHLNESAIVWDPKRSAQIKTQNHQQTI